MIHYSYYDIFAAYYNDRLYCDIYHKLRRFCCAILQSIYSKRKLNCVADVNG